MMVIQFLADEGLCFSIIIDSSPCDSFHKFKLASSFYGVFI